MNYWLWIELVAVSWILGFELNYWLWAEFLDLNVNLGVELNYWLWTWYLASKWVLGFELIFWIYVYLSDATTTWVSWPLATWKTWFFVESTLAEIQCMVSFSQAPWHFSRSCVGSLVSPRSSFSRKHVVSSISQVRVTKTKCCLLHTHTHTHTQHVWTKTH